MKKPNCQTSSQEEARKYKSEGGQKASAKWQRKRPAELQNYSRYTGRTEGKK